MDTLLIDIKNFLKKLENGQLDIEAGQWELHKDITNMQRSVEELKKLKEDVEVMRRNNAEQMGLIKNLEAKLELFSKRYKEDEPVTISQSSVEYETVYRRPIEGQQAPKGYKKRKCHVVRSEEIIEITSELSDKKSDEGSESRAEDSALEKEEENGQMSEENSSASAHRNYVHLGPKPAKSSKLRHQSQPFSNGILQRYLKDSAKYRERKISSSTDLSCSISEPSICRNPIRTEENNNIWDEYSSRLPQNQPRIQPFQPRIQNTRKNSSASAETTESVIPNRLICPKNLKKFNFKSDFPEHRRRTLEVRHVYHCSNCGKGFVNKNLLRAHKANHVGNSRKTKGFKCSYCRKICSSPEKLTLHMKNCRIIMRSHSKRR